METTQQIFFGVFDFINFGTETLAFYMFLNLFMAKRHFDKAYNWIFGVTYILLSMACTAFFNEIDPKGSYYFILTAIRQIIYIFMDLIYCQYLFKLENKKYRYIMYTGFFHLLGLLMESTVLSICYVVLPNFDISSIYNEYQAITLIAIGIFRLITFVLILLIKKFMGAHLWNLEWNGLLLITVFSAIFARAVFPVYWEQNDVQVYPLLMIVAIFLCLLNGFVFYHVATLKKATEMYIQARAAIERRNNFTAMMAAIQESARRIMHNIRDSLTVPLMSWLNYGEYEKAKQVLFDYDERLLNLYPVNFTGNADVDALLLIKSREAENSGVRFRVQGNWPEETGIFPDDLGSLLGCALDNAIGAARQADGKKEIEAIFFYNDSRLTLEITNTYNGKLHLSHSGKILSTKPAGGGLGIKIMRDLTKAYSGYVDIEFDENIFTLSAMLSMNKTLYKEISQSSLLQSIKYDKAIKSKVYFCK